MPYGSEIALNQTDKDYQPTSHPEFQHCHPEFISGSVQTYLIQILKRVQNDIIGCFLSIKEPATASTPPPRPLSLSARAFTLSEVLIVLVILGIVAMLTVPSLLSNVGDYERKSRFKKAYSVLSNAFSTAEIKAGHLNCFYWIKTPYPSQPCTEYWPSPDETICKTYGTRDPNYNGKWDQCPDFWGAVMQELRVVKACAGNGVTKGCMPAYTKGVEEVRKEANPGITDLAAYSGCTGLRIFHIKNNAPVYVLADGTIIFIPSDDKTASGAGIVVDVNGFRGPNKWGYDLFVFRVMSGEGVPYHLYDVATCDLVEKGGVKTATMLQKITTNAD